jgi:ComF family protein
MSRITPLRRLFALLAPHNCLVCGLEGALLCNDCRIEACLPMPDRCYRCRKTSLDSQVCARCRKYSHLSHVWVATEYSGTARQLMHMYKFERAQDAGLLIADNMDRCLPYLEKTIVVTHVPSATSRVRQRGFDHAKLLAVHLAHRRGFLPQTLLARQGQSRQVGVNRSVRLRQLKGAFRPLKLQAIKGAHILLIDDVITTGGSLEAAAKALLGAGARQVDAVVFAQKQ